MKTTKTVNFEKLAAQLDSVKADVKSKLGEQDAERLNFMTHSRCLYEPEFVVS